MGQGRNINQEDVLFCLRWTLATVLAIAGCATLGPFGLLAGPFALAIAQGLALRGYWRRAVFWGMAHVVGGYVALVAFVGLFRLGVMPLASVAVSYAIVGLTQGYVLRLESPWWRWWPVVSSVLLTASTSWFVTLTVKAAIYGSQRSGWEWVALAGLAGGVGGALKGLALIAMLKASPGVASH